MVEPMTPLAEPIPAEILEAEIDPHEIVTSFRGLNLLFFAGDHHPMMLQELGRIREREFRAVGAGRNRPVDIDERDAGPGSYRHLVVWDPTEREIVGAYRYLFGADLDRSQIPQGFRTHSLFEFSDEWIEDYLPHGVELGRSVVNRRSKRAFMGLFALWAGLGVLMAELPGIKFFFGNVSLYQSLPREFLRGLLAYLETKHPLPRGLRSSRPLLWPRTSAPGSSSLGPTTDQLEPWMGLEQQDGYAKLEDLARSLGTAVPPILVSYLSACPGLQYFGSSLDPDFGHALEAGIIVPIAGLSEKTRQRFCDSYQGTNSEALRTIHPSIARGLNHQRRAR